MGWRYVLLNTVIRSAFIESIITTWSRGEERLSNMASRRLRSRQWSFPMFWSLALVLAAEEFKCKYLRKRMRLWLQSSVTGKLDLYFVCILLRYSMSKDLRAAVIKSSHLLFQVLCFNWHLFEDYSCRGKSGYLTNDRLLYNVSNLRTFVKGLATLPVPRNLWRQEKEYSICRCVNCIKTCSLFLLGNYVL